MSFVIALRELWRMRRQMAAVGLLAAVVGLLMTFSVSPPFSIESRQHTIGIASARALVDTPSSQIVDLGGKTGADIRTLASRANLLASLMTSSPIKDEIARRAGVDAQLLVTPSGALPPAGAAAPADVSGALGPDDPRAFVLRTSVPTLESGEIPIIAVDTQAPDAAGAAKLADGAIAVLRAHIDNLAGNESVPQQRRVTVRELGPARSKVEVRGPSRLVALFAVLFVFGGGCGVLLVLASLARGWKAASEAQDPDVRAPATAPVEREPEPRAPDEDAVDDIFGPGGATHEVAVGSGAEPHRDDF